MHNNYYFLKRLCPELAENITGYTISQCFSQNKNELIIILSKGKKTFTIKAYLHSTFCCLSFPTSFQRSRKNNIDLFSPIINKTIVSVEQYKNERAFCFWLSDQSQLIFKMHGNRSNILWSVNDEVHQIFNNLLVKDLNIIPSQQHRPIDQSKGAFLATSANLKKLFPTFGKEIAQHLTSKGFDNANDSHQWDIIQDTVNELQTNDFYYSSLKYSLFSFENSFTNSSPIQAVTDFFVSYISQNQLSLEKGRVANILEKKISSTRAYITKASKKLQEIESRASYQVMADVIMANLHSIAKGMKEVTLSNFYDQQRPNSIKLIEHLSPQ